MPRPKIAVVTCLWRRHALASVVLGHYRAAARRLSAHVEIVGVAAGSEGVRSRRIASSAGWAYTETRNHPLTDKWSSAVSRARDERPDAVLIVGSDDQLCDGLLRYYVDLVVRGADYAGLVDQYFLRWSAGWESIRFPGYVGARAGEPVGLGRLISSAVLDSLDWRPWHGSADRGLDGVMTRRIDAIGVRCDVRRMDDVGGVAVDIKSSTNIWPYERFVEASVAVDPETILSRFPPATVEALRRALARPTSGPVARKCPGLSDR